MNLAGGTLRREIGVGVAVRTLGEPESYATISGANTRGFDRAGARLLGIPGCGDWLAASGERDSIPADEEHGYSGLLGSTARDLAVVVAAGLKAFAWPASARAEQALRNHYSELPVSNSNQRSSVRSAEAGLLAVVLIWGINFSVMKTAVQDLDALVFNAMRITLSVLFLGLLVWREEGWLKGKGRKTGGSWWPLLGLGVVGHLVYQTAFILGLERTTAGNSALLLGTAPLWTALVAHIANWERLGRGAWTGLMICVVGAILISLAHPQLGFADKGFVGDLLTVIAAMAWGAYTAGSKPLLRQWTSLGLAWRSMLVTLPLLWLVAWPRLESVAAEDLDSKAWGAVVYSGVLSTGVAYALWNIGIVQVGAARTAVFANLLPAVALVVAAVSLGEEITPAQVCGGALVVAGVLWMRRSKSIAAEFASSEEDR